MNVIGSRPPGRNHALARLRLDFRRAFRRLAGPERFSRVCFTDFRRLLAAVRSSRRRISSPLDDAKFLAHFRERFDRSVELLIRVCRG
jgi:hypothetical protein